MFTHVMVGTNDIEASKKFYDAVLGAIGHPAGQADPKGRIWYRTKTGSTKDSSTENRSDT